MDATARRSIPFLSLGGTAQARYERVREYVLPPTECQPRTSPVRFDLERFQRYGLLGLVDGEPRRGRSDGFEVQLVPVGAADAEERRARLWAVLGGLLTETSGGEHASSRVVRTGYLT